MDSVGLDALRTLHEKPFYSACYAPFVQLSFMTDGSVAACCMSRSEPLGNVKQEGLLEIWNGTQMQGFREHLRNGLFPTGCGSCEWLIDTGSIDGHPILQFDGYRVDAEVRWPARLEFAISNLCNLGCIHCSGDLSSVILAREGKPRMPMAYDERFFSDLRAFLPHLQTSSFLGGEPFLQPECHRIWDMMIELGLHAPVFVTTNGTVWNSRVERVLQELPVHLAISIDGVTKPIVESIRVNARYDKLMENLRRFAGYADTTRRPLQLNFCLIRQNWWEVADFFRFAETLKARVWATVVTSPSHTSLLTLPTDDLRRIADELVLASDEVEPTLTVNRDAWHRMIGIVRSAARGGRHPGDLDHVAAGWSLVSAGKLSEALAESDKTSAASPRYWHAVLLRAHVLRKMGDLANCEREIDRAMTMKPHSPEPLVARAWLRLDQGHLDDGIDAATQALACVKRGDAAEFHIHHVLGALLSCQGHLARALASFERMIELRPADSRARLSRGWAYLRAGMGREALAEAQAVLALAEHDKEAVNLREIALRQLARVS